MVHTFTYIQRFIYSAILFVLLAMLTYLLEVPYFLIGLASIWSVILYLYVISPLYNQASLAQNYYEQLEKSRHEIEQVNKDFDAVIQKTIKELQTKNKMLSQQSKLAIMGEMISMIAHQWRQPLSTISMLGSTMGLKIQMGKSDDEYIQKSLKKIEIQTKYLSETITDFSNFFKPDKQKEEVYLQSVIVKALRIMSRSLESSNILILEDYDISNHIEIYHNELMQVVINIIKNAHDALKEKETKNPVITINVTEENQTQILSIADNAGGIPENIIEKIFLPYFSTKGKNGTGIGLYMSKMIVEKHLEGDIHVENTKEGAMFIITLPIKTA